MPRIVKSLVVSFALIVLVGISLTAVPSARADDPPPAITTDAKLGGSCVTACDTSGGGGGGGGRAASLPRAGVSDDGAGPARPAPNQVSERQKLVNRLLAFFRLTSDQK